MHQQRVVQRMEVVGVFMVDATIELERVVWLREADAIWAFGRLGWTEIRDKVIRGAQGPRQVSLPLRLDRQSALFLPTVQR